MNIFFPIHAENEFSKESLPYTLDNTDNNISAKNNIFCELTAHYWAWKNLKNIDIIGLNHYRWYFDFFRSFSVFSPDRSFINKYEKYIIPQL